MERFGRNLLIDSHALTTDELRDIFDETDIGTYLICRKQIGIGNTLAITGWVLFFGGLTVALEAPSTQDNTLGAIIMLSFADIMIPTGYIIGGINKGRISRLADKYNRGETNNFSLSLQPSLMHSHGNNVAPGLGLAISF